MNEHEIDQMKARLLEEFLSVDIDREVLSDAIGTLEVCRRVIARFERLVAELDAEVAFQRSCGPT
jgi:hypothetical protein